MYLAQILISNMIKQYCNEQKVLKKAFLISTASTQSFQPSKQALSYTVIE